MPNQVISIMFAAAWALAAAYFLAEVARKRPFRHQPFGGRASRSRSLALALLFTGLSLNPTAALLRDHRALSILHRAFRPRPALPRRHDGRFRRPGLETSRAGKQHRHLGAGLLTPATVQSPDVVPGSRLEGLADRQNKSRS